MIGFLCSSKATGISIAGNWCTQQLKWSRFWTWNGKNGPSCQGKLMKSGLWKNYAHILKPGISDTSEESAHVLSQSKGGIGR